MKQKLQDLMSLLKRDRKTQVIAGAVALAVLFMIFGESNRNVGLPKRGAFQKPGTGAMGANEAYGDLVQRFNTDMETLKETTHNLSVAIETQGQKQSEYEQRTAEIFKRILERIAETEVALTNASLPGSRGPIDIGEGVAPMPEEDGAELKEEDSLESFINDGGGDVAPPAPPAPEKVAVVGAGDSVRVKLLAGVNAPTDGTPYPVVFKLVGDVLGPDGSTLPLGEGRLIAAAQGSLTDQRALFRLSSLNLRLPDGRRRVIPVDGWVVGEDGVRGMEGMLIDPIGKAIGGQTLAGGIAGFGEAFADSQVSYYNDYYGNQRSNVTGDIGKFAAGRAIGAGAREWSSLIKERAALLVPHVEVLSGREATAVFSKSFLVKDLYQAIGNDSGTSSLD